MLIQGKTKTKVLDDMKLLTNAEYKNRILEIMLKIDKICRENDIRYSIAYGTLLGSIRHQGFIPWDDDIDIAMTRGEYAKLKKKIIEHSELELNFIDITTQADTIYACGKICDTKTIVKESNFRSVDGYGAFVDVFPWDNIPDDEKESKKFHSRALYLARLIQHSSKRKPGKPEGIKHAFLLYGAFVYAHFFSTHKLIEKLDEFCKKYNETETKCFGLPYDNAVFKKADFDVLIDLPFEGHMLIGPKNYENVLRSSYGDYMRIPPLNKRIDHSIQCFLKE